MKCGICEGDIKVLFTAKGHITYDTYPDGAVSWKDMDTDLVRDFVECCCLCDNCPYTLKNTDDSMRVIAKEVK